LSDRFRTILALLLALTLTLTVFAVGGCAEEDTGDEDTDVSEGTDEGTDEDADADQPQTGGTMAFYINEPAFIDPVNLQESEGTQVGQSVFDSLVAFDPETNEVIPAAAESWESNEDATVWTFNLVPGATFHNGDPVTAADFKFAWERICNPVNESEISYHLAAVEGYDAMQAEEATELSGVVAVDDTTLEVTLQYPFADFEYVVGHPALAPVPSGAVDEGFSEMPIGNGSFMMSEPWAHDQYIKVERFDDYYGDAPYIDGVDFQIFADQDTAFLEFEAGNLDFTDLPVGQIESAIDTYGESEDGYSVSPGNQVLLGEEVAIYYLLMNNNDEVLSDPAVRRAFSLAINRQAICDVVFEGTRVPATGIVPPGIVGYEDDAWAYSKYDTDMAAQLLEEAGYPEGEGIPTINLEYNTGSGHEDILQLVQQVLEAVGIDSELVGTEWAQYLDKLLEGTYQAGRLGWIADYPIMDNFLYPLFTTGSQDNFAFYSDPAVDELLQAARQTTDQDERVAMYQEVEATVGEAAPVAPIMFYRHTRVASERVRNGYFNAQSLMNFGELWLADAAE
jgi:oligopeptide transport system substrate-binding protein